MRSKPTSSVQKQVEVLWREGTAIGLSDGELLEQFVDRRCAMPESAEAAFSAIVDRHGTMVLRACRRILGEEHEAQDAAQVTFLVLARRAREVAGHRSVGGWLHQVAIRVASKARIAAIRRRERERRHGERSATRLVERESAIDDSERWAELYEELARLPEKFRAPIVLCHLDGLTQEQAAAQLGWPLGTVQSRLARGRDKLRSRLIRRGVTTADGIVGAGLTSGFPAAAPASASWVEATTRAALAFTTPKSWAVQAGAGPASAGVAREILREMSFTKLKIAVAAALVVAAVLTSAVAFTRPEPKEPPVQKVDRIQGKPAASQKPAPPRAPDRTLTVRGVVRDERGRPLANVWIGSDPQPMPDTWRNPHPDDIREARTVYRDARGTIIPPGAVGKYFEVRDDRGQWKPVSPDDIKPFEAFEWGTDGQLLSREEIAKNHSAYSVRTARGRWRMADMGGMVPGVMRPVRTDDQGRFSITSTYFGSDDHPAKLHFASADFTLQAVRLVKTDDTRWPIDVTLRPTRLVRARVIEVPKDDPKDDLNWDVYTVDASGKISGRWQFWLPNPNANDSDQRHLEIRLPVGRYRIEFTSEALWRLVDLEVPPGDGPLDLPDMKLESRASVRMIGRPPAEIEADDLDGKPVRLADFRGKVIVLNFWSSGVLNDVEEMPRLIELQKRFHDRPVVFLALHDASLGSADAYRKAAEPLRTKYWGGHDLPFRVLLDRQLLATATPSDFPGPGETGSGRTARIYEVYNSPSLSYSSPSTFVIAPDGRLVGQFRQKALEGALEDQFGLPRSHPGRPDPFGILETLDKLLPKEFRNVHVKGKVVGPDGKAVVGAKVLPQQIVVRQRGIATGPEGEFAFMAEKIEDDHFAIRVEAPGLALKMFTLPATGVVPNPLKLGVGAVVTGRVLRDGRPVAGVSMGLLQKDRSIDTDLGELKARTDDRGRFRFDHVFADQELSAFAVTGSLPNHGAIVPRALRTGTDGTAIDLGDFEVRHGRKLAGRVVIADGKAIPPRTQVEVSCADASGRLRANLGADGRFEFLGLPETEVHVSLGFADIRTSPPAGYGLSLRNKCLDPDGVFRLVGRLDRDVDDLIILLEPGQSWRPNFDTLDINPYEVFKKARSGMIAGVPPESVPNK